ncbi:hypothetical protein AA0323_1644 [Asaia siamensis NRIC 0323]|nr:hypothetical protein AA0323_1644 [Asaia siamensis NRIC 0323]
MGRGPVFGIPITLLAQNLLLLTQQSGTIIIIEHGTDAITDKTSQGCTTDCRKSGIFTAEKPTECTAQSHTDTSTHTLFLTHPQNTGIGVVATPGNR